MTLFLFFFIFPSFTQAEEIFSQEIQNISTRYSHYLDSVWTGKGWNYSVPSSQYRENGKNSVGDLRMQATFAAAYQNRDDEDDKTKIRAALLNALIDLPKRQANFIIRGGKELSTRSFNDAIGLYLGLNILQRHEDWFSWTERLEMLHNAKQMLPWALKAPDTENRALLGAAYGLAVLNHPLLAFSSEEQEEYQKFIRKKIEGGLRSIDRWGVYREGRPARFSVHYQLVSAHMIAYVGEYLQESSYTKKAQQMFSYVHSRFPKGKLTLRGSFRPTGIGLQTVLLWALGERELGNAKWREYWNVEKKGRGFIDSKSADRLVWKDEVDKTVNDDYSFISMAEFLDRDE